IDSNALDGMWNGHMSASYAIDGHNWILPYAKYINLAESWYSWVKEHVIDIPNMEPYAAYWTHEEEEEQDTEISASRETTREVVMNNHLQTGYGTNMLNFETWTAAEASTHEVCDQNNIILWFMGVHVCTKTMSVGKIAIKRTLRYLEIIQLAKIDNEDHLYIILHFSTNIICLAILSGSFFLGKEELFSCDSRHHKLTHL
ncbi:hypothetical protein ACJX0J_012335, partial [Zea mays]